MKVNCHQLLHGHSIAAGFGAPVLESKKDGIRSFDFPFSDVRRSMPDSDRQNYVLEIEPVNSNFDYTAAICTQFTNIGSPFPYTNWLIPDNGKIDSTLKVLQRKNFMDSQQEIDAYEKNEPLTMRSFDVDDRPLIPEWQMNEVQQKTLGQFLALYWMSLTQNQPAIGKPGNRLLLVLRNAQTSELMKNEEAAAFFGKEIVSRLPLEAKGMVSAVFGVKNSESVSVFKRAVCVVLSTETGAPTDKKIDLIKGSHDILSKYKHDDREALNAIAQCLIQGEANYPKWYITLRSLRNGIPKTVAPLLMHFCHILRELENETTKQINQVAMYERCYMAIFKTAVKGGAAEDDVRKVLHPLAQKIADLWLTQQPDIEVFRAKWDWATKEVNISAKEAADLTEQLACNVLDKLKNNTKISIETKIPQTVELLSFFNEDEEKHKTFCIAAETFLSEHFEEWLFLQTNDAGAKALSENSFIKIIQNWKSTGLHKRPDEVKNRLLEVIEQYKSIPESVTRNALFSVDKLCLKALVRDIEAAEQQGEMPTAEKLRSLAIQIASVGSDQNTDDATKPALDLLQRFFHIWSLQEPAFVQGDNRFCDLTVSWLEHDTKNINDYNSAQIQQVEQNIVRTLANYGIDMDEQDRVLLGLRKKKGMTQLKEIIENSGIDDTAKALGVAGLHRVLRRSGDVLKTGDELDKQLCDAISDRFLDWGKAEKPFASSEELRYDDNWFVSVAESWLKDHLREYIYDFNADELKMLETNLKSTFDAYHTSEEQKNNALQQIRLAKSEKLVREIRESGDNLTSQALKIAGIHNELRKIDGILDHAEVLADMIRDELVDLFLDWEKADKPFASSEDLRYEDSWFISVAQKWMSTGLDQAQLHASELEKLEKDLIEILSVYKMPRDEQNKLLLDLRCKWAAEKLNDANNLSADDPAKAICIAGIHSRMRQFNGALSRGNDLEESLDEAIRGCFLAWQKSEKPFVSSDALRYDDDWFVFIANDWLQNELREANLDANDLENLQGNLITAFSAYKRTRDQQNKDLVPLRAAWCRAKLDEVRIDSGISATDAALCIAGIHTLLIKQLGADVDTTELESDLQTALREQFIAWSEAEKPFASGKDLRYEDGKFFETVATEWLTYDLSNEKLDANQYEHLEEKLKSVFSIYKILRSRQDELLLELRKAWGKAKISDVQFDGSLTRPQQALQIAGIHNRLRVIQGAIEPDDELSHDLEAAILDLFIDWENAEKPFASSESLRYEDDWFVKVAQIWLRNNQSENMNDEQIKKLEDDFMYVFNNYRVPKEKQNSLLCSLRLNRCLADLTSANLSMHDDAAKALCIAGIHKRYRQIAAMGFEENPAIESDIRKSLKECFVFWSEAQKPFASGPELRYDDDCFISIAEEWLSYDVHNTDLNADQLDRIGENIKAALNAYRVLKNKQNEMLLPLRKDWGEKKLRETLEDTSLSNPDKAIRIADIHNRLRLIPNALSADDDLELQLQSTMLEYFVDWAEVVKPFASGLEFRYEDNLFSIILQQWCIQRMNYSTDLDAEAFSTLMHKIEDAAKLYKLREWETQRKLIRERNAELCILEETSKPIANEESVCKIANILFCGDVSEQNTELRSKLVDYLAENFAIWANTTPAAFRIQDSSIVGFQQMGRDIFMDVLRRWKEIKLDAGDVNRQNAVHLRETIQKTCEACHIYSKEYTQELFPLDMIIYREQLDQSRMNVVTPETVSKLAGIRKKLEDMNGEGDSKELLEDITEFLTDNIPVWSQQEQPLYVDGFGYKDKSVPMFVENWLLNKMNIWDMDELQKLRQRLIEASRQYKTYAGKEISQGAMQRIDVCECEAFLNHINPQMMDEEQIKTASVWLEKIPTKETTLVDKLERGLVLNFVRWSECNPPFAISFILNENSSFGLRLAEIAYRWSSNEMASIDLSSGELETIARKLQTINSSLGSDKMDMAISAVRLQKIRKQLVELQSNTEWNEATTTALASLCRAVQGLNGNEDLKRNAYQELLHHFVEWGIAGKFGIAETSDNERTGELHIDVLIDEWISSAQNIGTEELEKIREHFEAAAKTIYRLDEDVIAKISQKLQVYEAHRIISMMSQANLDNAVGELTMAAVSLLSNLSKRGEQTNEILAELKDSLLKHYIILADNEKVVRESSIFIEITEEWMSKILPGYSFADIQAVNNLEEKIEEKYTEFGASEDQIHRLQAAFMERWLNIAISVNTEMSTVTIPEIAGVDAEIKSIGASLTPESLQKLDQFLMERFDRWANDDFRAESKNGEYSFDHFTDIVKAWMATGVTDTMQVSKLENIAEKLERALTYGYKVPSADADELLRPLEKTMKQALLQQVREMPTEENMSKLRALYEEETNQYYDQICQIYIDLAKEGSATDQVADFAKLQAEMWNKLDEGVRDGIVNLLESLCDAYSTQIPETIPEAMTQILTEEHFRISQLSGNRFKHWNEQKERLLFEAMKVFLKKNSDSDLAELSDEWNTRQASNYGVSWYELADYSFFVKAMHTWLDRAWTDLQDNNEKLEFISSLKDQTSKVSDSSYKRVLFEELTDYTEKNYESLCVNEKAIDQLNEVILYLEENRHPVSSLHRSITYMSNAYRRGYEKLLNKWDEQLLQSLLRTRPVVSADIVGQLTTFDKKEGRYPTDYVLLLSIMRHLPGCDGNTYWNDVLKGMGTPDLAELNQKDLREIKDTNFMSNLKICFDTIKSMGFQWMLDDLKNCIMSMAPVFWKNMHGGVFSSGIKKLVADGWRGLPADFADWLRN